MLRGGACGGTRRLACTTVVCVLCGAVTGVAVWFLCGLERCVASVHTHTGVYSGGKEQGKESGKKIVCGLRGIFLLMSLFVGQAAGQHV